MLTYFWMVSFVCVCFFRWYIFLLSLCSLSFRRIAIILFETEQKNEWTDVEKEINRIQRRTTTTIVFFFSTRVWLIQMAELQRKCSFIQTIVTTKHTHTHKPLYIYTFHSQIKGVNRLFVIYMKWKDTHITTSICSDSKIYIHFLCIDSNVIGHEFEKLPILFVLKNSCWTYQRDDHVQLRSKYELK